MNEKIILLVEDNADDELLTKRAFRKNNIKNALVVVRDGVEALEWLFREGEHANRDPSLEPQVILLDIKLPRLDGLEVLRRFKESDVASNIPVVVLTTSDEDRDIRSAYELGANSYIVKPVDFDKFMDVASQIELYWVALNQPTR